MTSTKSSKTTNTYDLYRGTWAKLNGYYNTNAFGRDVEMDSTNGYAITITKEDGAWFFYAEEHDIDELVKMGHQPEEGFKTLKAAKEAAEEWGELFESLWLQAELECA